MGVRGSAGLFGTGAALVLLATSGAAQQAPPAQPRDEEYTRLIAKHLQDPRITTELVDHMPASATVPSPLKFFGRIPGTPDELTYARDIHRYFAELGRTSPRVRYMKLGETEEGRDIVVLAVADEAVLAKLEENKAALAALADPRRTDEAEARRLIGTAKPIYWLTSGIHSTETGGPETLMELGYRLAVEDTPFIRHIRENVVTFITPVVEVDGREKMVDTFYYGKTGKPKPPLVYWGQYVAHDNNRDGMGQLLKLTQAVNRGMLEWHPTVLHDLHESLPYLYTSTGSGPYNPSLDPIASSEWWLLAQTEVMEMTKRGVPGVWTYGFYDGWVPNYLFWIANNHNSFGRFYEVQAYGPDIRPEVKLEAASTSREWYRQNPPLPTIRWGPRNHVNISQSAVLIALHKVATDRALYLENYRLKNKRAVEAGRAAGAVNAWVIPAAQTARLNAADMVNTLRRQGVEIGTANAAFTAGGVRVAAGDYLIRADQPYRTLLDMYLGVQTYPVSNPRPYDDTGWTMQLMRNVQLREVRDPAVFAAAVTPLAADVAPRGTVTGTGSTILIDHNGDNQLVSLRFRLRGARMLAAEAPFTAEGRTYAAGTFILPNANRAEVERVVAELGLSAQATASAPAVATHPLTAPRIGLMHSWLRTQDEGWWRAALDHHGIPYDYFADIEARRGNLRAKYDVIIYPTVGPTAQDALAGVPKDGGPPVPYKKTATTPHLGRLDQADDIRGGLGVDGLAELRKFAEAGGLLMGDGSTVEMLAEFGVAPGVTLSRPAELYTKGAIMRGVIADKASPIAYGYRGDAMPIYFSQAPVLSIGRPGRPPLTGQDLVQNLTPNAGISTVSPWEAQATSANRTPVPNATATGAAATPAAPATPAAANAQPAVRQSRVVMRFPAKEGDILLSGLLHGGRALGDKALIVDVPVGRGHMVLYANRPFWRWQTQGSYFLGFNAILNWDRLDAGLPAADAPRP